MTLPELSLALYHLATPQGATPAQIGSFLTGFRVNGFDRRADVLALFAGIMRELAVGVGFGKGTDGEEEGEGLVCDIVGTGGDGQNTFNVSTTAGIVVAGTGARVYKVSHFLQSVSGGFDLNSRRNLKLHLYSHRHFSSCSVTLTQIDNNDSTEIKQRPPAPVQPIYYSH